jgi:hypothetical protein
MMTATNRPAHRAGAHAFLLLLLAVPAALAGDPFSAAAEQHGDAAVASSGVFGEYAVLAEAAAQALYLGPATAIPPAISSNPSAVPTIVIPSECTEACQGLPYSGAAVFSSDCALCLIIYPALPSWPINGAQFGSSPSNPAFKVDFPLARVDLLSLGYTNVPSIPLLWPRRYLTFDPRAFGPTQYAYDAQAQSTTNDIWGGGVAKGATWTIDGVTRPIVSTTHARVPLTCVLEVGWITPNKAPVCPGTPDFDVDANNVHFPSLAAAADAIPLPYDDSSRYRPRARTQIARAFASAEGAAQAAFDSTQGSYSTAQLLKNVTRASAPDRLADLQALYGQEEWEDAWTALAEAGDLVEIDLTYTQGMAVTTPGPDSANSGWWNVAAHALFAARTNTQASCKSSQKELKEQAKDLQKEQRESGSKKNTCVRTTLKPLAIRLSNQPSDPNAALVYTPQKSETAYVAASVALRQAITQAVIWNGHVFNLHIFNVAATLALYNKVDPSNAPYHSTAPVRQVLDFWADPTYVSNFHSFLFSSGYLGGPGTAAGVPDLLNLWQRWSAAQGPSGATWANNMMRAQLAASGLSELRFRGSGGRGAWEGLPAAAFHLKAREMAGAYAKAAVEASYADDAAVAADAQVQAMAAALCDPEGSNVVELQPEGGCALDTRAKLAAWMADWVSLIAAHSSAHLQDYVLRIMNMPLAPPAMGKQEAPDPEATYGEDDYLQWVPKTRTAARQVSFFANFVATSYTFAMTNMAPSQQWQKGDVPVWGDDLPLFTGSDPEAFGTAHVAFIKAVARLYETTPEADGFRDVTTNYQQPTRVPRLINI